MTAERHTAPLLLLPELDRAPPGRCILYRVRCKGAPMWTMLDADRSVDTMSTSGGTHPLHRQPGDLSAMLPSQLHNHGCLLAEHQLQADTHCLLLGSTISEHLRIQQQAPYEYVSQHASCRI